MWPQNYLWNWVGVTVGTGFKVSLSPLISQAFYAGGLGILVPAHWRSPRRLTLLPPAHHPNTKPLSVRHKDNFLPWSWWPSSGNPAQMWSCRLGSWQLAVRRWKKPQTLFSCFQAFSGMPQSYPEPLNMHFFPRHDLEVNDQRLLNTEQTFSRAHVFSTALPRKQAQRLGQGPAGPQMVPTFILPARQRREECKLPLRL